MCLRIQKEKFSVLIHIYLIFHCKSTKKYGINRFIITFVLKLCHIWIVYP